ncbi:hypothetical protein PN485_10795 [Nodularia spumigena CS-588/05]|nr:hypothetical protein [Nodularia spumigena CS-588/01]MDB9352485.1 hypothetical protein [Nodularia spumigena CS-588/05]
MMNSLGTALDIMVDVLEQTTDASQDQAISISLVMIEAILISEIKSSGIFITEKEVRQVLLSLKTEYLNSNPSNQSHLNTNDANQGELRIDHNVISSAKTLRRTKRDGHKGEKFFRGFKK